MLESFLTGCLIFFVAILLLFLLFVISIGVLGIIKAFKDWYKS